MTKAELKRKLTVGVLLTMVRNDWYPANKLLGQPRQVSKVQTNAIALVTNGRNSWFYWPKARELRIKENSFDVCLRQDGSFAEVMTYNF